MINRTTLKPAVVLPASPEGTRRNTESLRRAADADAISEALWRALHSDFNLNF